MEQINLVKDNQSFFKQLKKKAVKRGTPLTTSWAKMSIVLGLKLYLQIEE